ncbi:MAG: hypothetical protein Q9160_003105 [Pyrenula sp. 1 TL-2023]
MSSKCHDECYGGRSLSFVLQAVDPKFSVAKDRGWFTNYVLFESSLGSLYIRGQNMKVEGVGSVELPTKRKLQGSGAELHSTLKLAEVLHVPSAICNIIGEPMHDEYASVKVGRGIFDMDGRRIACFDPSRPLSQIKLSGPPVGPEVGPRALQHDVGYLINVQWSNRERQRWEAYQASVLSSKAAYTDEERAWLKNHYGGEFHFLLSYGLKMHDDEDREDGRAILRALMQQDD